MAANPTAEAGYGQDGETARRLGCRPPGKWETSGGRGGGGGADSGDPR